MVWIQLVVVQFFVYPRCEWEEWWKNLIFSIFFLKFNLFISQSEEAIAREEPLMDYRRSGILFSFHSLHPISFTDCVPIFQQISEKIDLQIVKQCRKTKRSNCQRAYWNIYTRIFTGDHVTEIPNRKELNNEFYGLQNILLKYRYTATNQRKNRRKQYISHSKKSDTIGEHRKKQSNVKKQLQWSWIWKLAYVFWVVENVKGINFE